MIIHGALITRCALVTRCVLISYCALVSLHRLVASARLISPESLIKQLRSFSSRALVTRWARAVSRALLLKGRRVRLGALEFTLVNHRAAEKEEHA